MSCPYKNTQMCKHPSQEGFKNIYKMYKNMYYCVIVLLFPQCAELIFYHGLQTESEVSGGAASDTWWLF